MFTRTVCLIACAGSFFAVALVPASAQTTPGAQPATSPANEQTISVSEATPAGWTVSGAAEALQLQENQVVLPAGTQLGRSFPSSAVMLHLITKPVFSLSPEEWPILQVGQAALAFLRQGNDGRLVLVLDEKKTVDLPWKISLDQAVAPVELVLAYDPLSGVGLIGIQDKVELFATAADSKPAEVWLAAGESDDWPLDLMQVMILTDDSALSAGSGKVENGKANQLVQARKLKAAFDRMLSKGTVDGSPGSTRPALTADGPPSSLEVFTPPAVRRARVEAVRDIVAKRQTK